MEVTVTGYDDALKRQCMYKVLDEYSSVLRPALYPQDSKFALLASMCAMIDRSREIAETFDGKPSIEKAPEWRLAELTAAFEKLDSGVAASASLTTRQRLRLMDNFVVKSPYL